MTSTDFTPEEQAVMDELKRRTADCVTPKMLEDNLLFYRFAKARDFKLADAESMLRNYASWRAEFGMDTILTDYQPAEVYVKYVSTCLMCFDKEGRSVRYVDIGQIDARGLMNCGKHSELLKYCAFQIEKDIKALLIRNKKLGKQIFTPIFDLENIQCSIITSMKVLVFAKYFLTAYVDYFPEQLKYAFIINAPFYFSWPYAVLKQVLPDSVVSKVQVYGTDGWKEKLLEVIDADDLPAFLGGNKTDPDGNPQCRTFVQRGEPIPKRYYMTNDKKKTDNEFEKLTVRPFSKEEISFEVTEMKSNLEWEFELKSKNIDFCLYFRGETMEPVELIPRQRTSKNDRTEKGFFKCEKMGIYTIVFDNSYSWIFSKEVHFKAAVNSPRIYKSEHSL